MTTPRNLFNAVDGFLACQHCGSTESMTIGGVRITAPVEQRIGIETNVNERSAGASDPDEAFSVNISLDAPHSDQRHGVQLSGECRACHSIYFVKFWQRDGRTLVDLEIEDNEIGVRFEER